MANTARFLWQRLESYHGLIYFVPEAEIRNSVVMCEKQHGLPPQAWVETKTKVIAFGKVVPTVDAPALEESVR